MTCLPDALVLDLVEGRLTEAVLAQVDDHLDACVSCRAVVTTLAQARGSERVLARGTTLGKYVIGDLLGMGAMGRVYSAWEPELDRRVAVKVLREERDRDRLLREAQAMAKLSHPNVVTVYEAGRTSGDAGDAVFVAMELVDGETLRAWAQQAHPWRERARVLGEVARGLAAVHGAGVIHRDLKPDNVIVGADGRARIGDFGLARSGAPVEASTSIAPPVTTAAGTPAYMAPEVLRGAPASEASDQFSFGVTAYEVLAGSRPFAAQSWSALIAEIERGSVARLRDVPAWLDELVRRCLAVEPARRFPSLRAVADRIAERASRRSPTAWLVGGVALGAIASAVAWFAVRPEPAAQTCVVGEQAVARVWTPAQRQLFAAHPAVANALDHWATAWATERDAACHANLPPPRLAARERCLSQRLAEVDSMLRTVGDPHAFAPVGAARAAGGAAGDSRELVAVLDALAALPAPADCRSADESTADPVPVDPTRRAEVAQVAAQLPVLRAQVALGRTKTTALVAPADRAPSSAVTSAERTSAGGDPREVSILERTAALVATARSSGHAPTLAEALTVHAEALRTGGTLGDAAAAARDAAAAAERGHADALAAQAWLVRVAIAIDRRELESADDLGAIAQAVTDRAGGQPHLAAALLRLRGLGAYNRGHYAEARELLGRARTAWVSLAGEHSLQVAQVDSALGSVARAEGKLDEAEEHHRAALAIDRELRGPSHPDVARDLHNIAGVLRLRGDLDAALATYREALAIEVALDGETAAAGLTNNSIGLVLMARKQWSDARAELTAARDALARSGHGDRAFAEHNLGLVSQALGDHTDALRHFDRADSVYAATIGPDAPAAIRLLVDRARSELALDDPLSARDHARFGRERARQQNIEWIETDANAVLAKLAGATWSVATPAGVETSPPGSPPSTSLGSAAPVPAVPPPPRPPTTQPVRDVGVYGASQN